MDLGLGQVLDQAWTMAGPGPWLGQYMYMAGTMVGPVHVHGWWTVGPPAMYMAGGPMVGGPLVHHWSTFACP